jgi:hypothetical protein
MTGYLDAMNKQKLSDLLEQTVNRYSKYPFQRISELPDDLFVEIDSGGIPSTNPDYWQIEIEPLQKWNENNLQVIQLMINVRGGTFHLGSIIEFYSNGNVSFSKEIFEFINGIPHSLESR